MIKTSNILFSVYYVFYLMEDNYENENVFLDHLHNSMFNDYATYGSKCIK